VCGTWRDDRGVKKDETFWVGCSVCDMRGLGNCPTELSFFFKMKIWRGEKSKNAEYLMHSFFTVRTVVRHGSRKTSAPSDIFIADLQNVIAPYF
jgi:hypothetical protein